MKKTWVKAVLAGLFTAIAAGIYFYIKLPAINIFSQGFWIFLALIFGCFIVLFSILNMQGIGELIKNKTVKDADVGGRIVGRVALGFLAAPLVVLLIGTLGSSQIFNAQRYANVISVPEGVFEEEMPESAVVSNIALMDTETAVRMGKRTLGALSSEISQYEISSDYKQINYQRAPQKVSTLEYADFFKWLSNREKGIPGYVMVDPVNFADAKYVALQKPIKYTDSAYFGEDLDRKLRISYPTKIFGNRSFEIDDEGNPYYIVSCMSPKVFMFGAMDVKEVIIFNPVDGTSQLFALDSTPSWVDNVFTGQLASQKYDWHGMLKNGYWNSIIGNKDCKVTTDDFGYITQGDDVLFFTGVTSVTSDESNVGFITSNARTGEYRFYSVIGAEEYSAMEAAQGEVQEKGYRASFPSLINVAGEPTYIMVLKDENSIVKLYALVNVEQYSIVATGTKQSEAKEKYITLLKDNNKIPSDTEIKPENSKEAEIVISDIRDVISDGNSVIYIRSETGELYKQSVLADETVMLLREKDKIKITYTDTENEKIKQIIKWSYVNG